MKFNGIIMTAILALSALTMSAQTKEVTVTEDAFNPHWYIQAQFGVQETLGEASFGDLISPNAQIAAGYNFCPYLGARLAINSWSSKGALQHFGTQSSWKWSYIAPTVNATIDLTNIIGGYKADRFYSVGLLAGLGVNVAFNNDQAGAVKEAFAQKNVNALENYWTGSKALIVGQFGAYADFHVTKKLSVGVELQANVLPDSYNSKKAGNADWYFNALVGVKYTFGDRSKKVTRTKSVPAIVITDTVYVDRIVEKTVKVPAHETSAVGAVEESMRRDVFFAISKYVVRQKEMGKIAEIADYLKAHPKASVHVMGYADKGTGSKQVNLRISEQRAKAVVKVLTDKYGIALNRIVIDSMDEKMEQPYSTPAENRVVICIAE